MAGIYIHIPFCKQACHYCDFHFSTVKALKEDIISAMVKEVDLQKNYLKKEEIDTIYFGGGTPSILELPELEKILYSVYNRFKISKNAEVTLEANPDDLNLPKLNGLYSLGVNRLSIGIQTFNHAYLKYLNRAHDAEMAIKSYNNARKAGFANISIDLIYAIKEEADHKILRHDLEMAQLLAPEHISAYCLTIEPHTTFGNWLKKARIKAIHEEYAAKEFEILTDTLEKLGYEQYEISNFARDGFYSRHNSSYWKGASYLGIGPSAHSFNGVSRQFNVAHNAKYIKAIAEKLIPCEFEELSEKDRANELVMTGLRTQWGCDLHFLAENLGYDLLALNQAAINEYLASGLVIIEKNVLKLTKPGKLLADEIAARLFWV